VVLLGSVAFAAILILGFYQSQFGQWKTNRRFPAKRQQEPTMDAFVRSTEATNEIPDEPWTPLS
jgi:hypothetical protein